MFFALAPLGIMWVVFLSSENASNWGIFPRSVQGLRGILTAPFIHGSQQHLLANSLPFAVLLAGLIYFYRKIAFPVFVGIYFVTGFWVWVAARPAWHIGASGLVYGLAFFLFFSGVFRKDRYLMAISLIVSLFYGGMVWGLLPLDTHTSWESHVLGAMSGIVFAFYFKHRAVYEKKEYDWKQKDLPQDATGPWNYREILPPPEGYDYPEENNE